MGRLIRGTVDDMNTVGILMSCENMYDSLGRPHTSTYVIEGKTVSYIFTYRPNSSLISSVGINCNGSTVNVLYDYDDLYRIASKEINCGTDSLIYRYIFKDNGSYSGTLISEIAICYANDTNYVNYLYTYDGN